jgi:hypothetical protein
METENHDRFYFLFEDARNISTDADRKQIMEILSISYDNAYDTVRIEKAVPASDWDVIFVGTIQSQLCQGVNRHIKSWFANRGITY